MNWYLLGGPGINTYRTFYDATDDSGNPHNFNNVVKSTKKLDHLFVTLLYLKTLI